ncbi:tRNA (adenine(58)-N(1))-methyltransferase, mitochondrial-like [Saccoglossus kowalevskii]|uniref:tRNA (adenine(58)-N(1))-methyltransferase n=1 Tax=Saccoglossus kowalevskii TaxID=10224 RepID=A0ABM0MHL3_SACKO|nr:PREDICTED: tRNA (adenine(58)-N(1))-methyltransferase, mitochondrial-like [Saccoglossus kowalevskii]
MTSGLRVHLIQQMHLNGFKLNVSCCVAHLIHTCSTRKSTPTDRSPENPKDKNDEACNTNLSKLKQGHLNLGRARRRTTLSVLGRVSGMLPRGYNLNLEKYDDSSLKTSTADAIDHSKVAHAHDGQTTETDVTENEITDSYFNRNELIPSQVKEVVAELPREDAVNVIQQDSHDEETTPFRHDEDVPFVDGELVVVTRECHKRHEFLNKMFNLNSSKTFTTQFGAIKHSELIGCYPGKYFPSTRGHKHYVKRASLDDFTVLMNRTPVISYPRDCITACMMIDASPGSKILEAGSGSGGISLFLSRAVGRTGHVYSFDIKEKHHKTALANFTRWQKSWNLTHKENKWKSNVSFYHRRLEDSEDILGHTLFDGAIIDMEHAYRAMSFVAGRLKSGRSVAIFVANITQIIEILEHIRINNIPLKTETISEVTHKNWLVSPATRRDGKIIRTYSKTMVDPTEGEERESRTENGKVVYTARPSFHQDPPSAFLLELQKES